MMDGRDTRPSTVYKLAINDPAGKTDVILAVDLDPKLLLRLPKSIVKPGDRINRTEYESLDQVNFTGEMAPDLVLSPLLTAAFDALDLARYLTQRAYHGRYLALVDRLPSATLIRKEVEAHAPKISFDVYVLDGSTQVHSV